ncbi:Uncharacterized protein FKW44_012376, partial [Caligus rogercresseyi]
SYSAVIHKRQVNDLAMNQVEEEEEENAFEDIIDSIETVAFLGADTLSSLVDTKKEIQN